MRTLNRVKEIAKCREEIAQDRREKRKQEDRARELSLRRPNTTFQTLSAVLDGEVAVGMGNAAVRVEELANVRHWALEGPTRVVGAGSVTQAGLLPKYPPIKKFWYSRNELNISGRRRRR